jgi:phage/plasmid-like protein (TIGR03299 family)
MAHEFEQGFFVRKPAWHNLGKVVAEYPGREEAMKLAGHGFKVFERQIFTTAQDIDIKAWKALIRSDTDAVLSVVKGSYQPIQNEVLWDVLDAIVKEPNVKYETAGVLKNGRLLWALAKLDEPWTVPGDDSQTLPYVNVGLGHDGETPLEAYLTSVRTVCRNTYRLGASIAKRDKLYFSFKHTKNVMDRVEEARNALRGIRDQFECYKELTLELATHKVTPSGIDEFLKKFIPEVPQEEEPTERAMDNVEEARARYIEFFNGITVAAMHRRTAYGLFCAGTEFLDHGRAYRSDETYFKRSIEPSPQKDQLIKLALAV